MDTKFNKTTLGNGLTIISEKLPNLRSVSIGVWVRAGSREETPENSGISHFIEHIVFKGTEKRKTFEITDSIESAGGYLNAFTGKEFTCFYAHILNENLELAVDVLSDLICNPKIDPLDITKEKQVILEEINSLHDSPEELVFEYFQENLFVDHPLALSILGTKDSVRSLDRNTILEYMEDHYSADKIIVAAAGDFDHNDLIDLVEKYFKLKKGNDLSRFNGLKKNIPVTKYYKKSINQAHICTGNLSISYKDPQKYSLILLHLLIGGGMNSRLFQELREKQGIAYSVYSFLDFYSDHGIFGVYCGVDTSKVEFSLELIRKEFMILSKNELSDVEINKLKKQLKGNLVLGLESSYSRMNRIAKMEIYLQKYYNLDEVIAELNKVNSIDIKNIAAGVLEGDQFTIVLSPN